MTFGRTIWRGASALALGGLLLVGVACSGDDNDGATALGGGKTLSECEYAKALTEKLNTFSTSFGSVLESDGSGADATKAFDTLDTQLENIIKEMKTLKSTSEVNEINSAFVSALEDLRKDLPEAKKAAQAGDLDTMTTTTAKALEDFGAKVDKSDKEHADLSSRLTKCES